jgi:hypothetical protein
MLRYLSDDDLTDRTTELEAYLHRSTGWHEPPRLYGLVRTEGDRPDQAGSCARRSARRGPIAADEGHVWTLLAEGDPYEFLDEVRVDERQVTAVALATCGRTIPLDEQGRPRVAEERERRRVRLVVVVTPDLRYRSAVRVREPGADVSVTDTGEGPMMRALLSVWWEGGCAA